MDTTTQTSIVKHLICELRRLAASRDGADIYDAERDVLAETLGIPATELDAQFKKLQRHAATELRAWFLRCWFRAYASRFPCGATQRAAFPS